MRVAIPLADRWVARILDSAEMLLVVDLRRGGRWECFQIPFQCRSLDEGAERLALMGVETVVCDELSRELESMILTRGIAVLCHVTGNADEVLEGLDEQPGRTSVARPRGSRLVAASG